MRAGIGGASGIQAEFVASHLSVPKISTGDIFRANVAAGTPLGVEAKRFMDGGQLVPDRCQEPGRGCGSLRWTTSGAGWLCCPPWAARNYL